MSKQKQLDRTKESKNRKSTRTKNEPPSWSELGQEVSSNNSLLKITGVSSLILLGLAISPISSASVGIFGVVGILSYINKLTRLEAIAVGGFTGLLSALFSSLFFSVITLGAFTLPFILIGAFIALIADYIAKKLN